MFEGYEGTCSIENLINNRVTFARNITYLKFLPFDKRLMVIIPPELEKFTDNFSLNVSFYVHYYPDWVFTMYHNEFYKDQDPPHLHFADGFIHESVQIHEGIHVVIGPNGERVQTKHMGNVRFGRNVWIGALTMIERGVLPGCSTVIGNGVKIDCCCMVGHNAVIGENTVLATGAFVGASCVIGKECWLGNRCNIKPHTRICDGVVVGTGANVVKDITEPGMYVGNPAKFLKEVPRGWIW